MLCECFLWALSLQYLTQTSLVELGFSLEQNCQIWISRFAMESLKWEGDFILVYFAMLNNILKKVILIIK